MFAAIACSNGWSPTTTALQLFAHLDGEALNVAFLMPVQERERWTAFVRGLSDYFNSPGRLAAVRRRFESVIFHLGVDPATFATELGVLAMQGFDDMGERAHGLMIRNFPFCWLVGRLVFEMAVAERHGRTWMDGAILQEKGDGPGGRVSLSDHRRS